MENKKYKWERRAPEWIKENPGKGTMYKVFEDGTIEEPKQAKTKPVEIPLLSFCKATDAGVYVIENSRYKYAYVGQSKNMGVRLRNHKMNIISVHESDANVYLKMRQHYRDGEENDFEFIRYVSMPNATQTALLEKEKEVMSEYVRLGYTLYNLSVNVTVEAETIYCPIKYQELIKSVVKKLTDNEETENRLYDWLSMQG